MSGDRFDWVVIGSGPGGYVAAIRAAQLGQRVAIVEEDRPGGVCLNWGCIPSKALLTGAELVENVTKHGETFGVRADRLELDYSKVVDHSRKTADRLCKGVQGLFKKNRIELVAGRGRMAGPHTVEVSAPADRVLEAERILVATGSAEWVPPGLDVDGDRVLTSREALEKRDVPERLVVIGAGAVGIEFAYVYAMYGAQVTVLEMMDQMIPGADPDVAQALQREFRRKGIEVRLGTRFEKLERSGAGLGVAISSEKGNEELGTDRVLAAIGRRPQSADLGLEEAGVALDERGFVRVDARLQTSVPSIGAIGDVAGGALLAHKASEEGIAAVEFAAGLPRPELHHERIPACIYAQPQIGWVGLGEAEARERWGDDLKVGKFPFTASGKALAAGHSAGFAKILAEPEYGAIVGAHVVGAGATERLCRDLTASRTGRSGSASAGPRSRSPGRTPAPSRTPSCPRSPSPRT